MAPKSGHFSTMSRPAFPPYIMRQLRKVENSMIDKSSFDDSNWTLFSDSSIDHETLFQAFSYLVKQMLVRATGDKSVIAQNIFNKIKLSPLLLDAFLAAFYEKNDKSQLNAWTRFVNDDLSQMDWGALRTPHALHFPVPSEKSYDFFIINTVLAASPPAEIANSDYTNVSSQIILSKLSEKAAANFVDSHIIKCGETGECLPNFIFQLKNLLNAFLRMREDYQLMERVLSYSFVKNPYIITSITHAWETKDPSCSSRFIMHLVFPFAKFYPENLLSEILNSGIQFLDKEIDIGKIVSSTECMNVAGPRIIIDICSADMSFQSILFNKYNIMQRIPPVSFLEELLCSLESTLPSTTVMFHDLLASTEISQETLEFLISCYLLENPVVVCDFLYNAFDDQAIAQMVTTDSILNSITDLISTYPALTLKVLEKATLKVDCSMYWKESDACAILVDEIITKRQNGITVECFFDNLARQADETTIVSILPTISAIQSLLERFSLYCKERFPPDSIVNTELSRLSY